MIKAGIYGLGGFFQRKCISQAGQMCWDILHKQSHSSGILLPQHGGILSSTRIMLPLKIYRNKSNIRFISIVLNPLMLWLRLLLLLFFVPKKQGLNHFLSKKRQVRTKYWYKKFTWKKYLGQKSKKLLGCKKIVGPKNIWFKRKWATKMKVPKKLGPKSLVKIMSVKAETMHIYMDKCPQDMCCQDKCHHDSQHLLKKVFECWSELGH